MYHIHSRLLYLDADLSEDGEGTFLQNQVLEPAAPANGLFPLLLEIRKEYSGITAKGVEALLFRATGYTGKEIASMHRLYHQELPARLPRTNSGLHKIVRVHEADAFHME